MTTPAATAAAPAKLRILWVNCRLLHPLNGGDRIRTYNMLRQLKRQHHVTYLCFRGPDDSAEAERRALEFCHEVITVPLAPPKNGTLKFFLQVLVNSLFGRIPFYVEKYRSAALTAHIQRLTATSAVDLIIADYLASMVHFTGWNEVRRTPLLIFQHNVESQIWKRHTETAANPVKRFVFRRQWRLARAFEYTADALADGQVTVSEDDARLFREDLGLKNILGAVPTGVDCDYFAASQWPRQEHSLVFLGSMDWMPNIDAVEFFTGEIWPTVKRKYPHATFTIVGRNPPPKVKELEKRIPGVRVTGTVDDVRPFLAAATAMVVPLRVGGGTRIKIFEGMATGIPVISTRIGAEGLPVKHAENILLADTPADFSAQIAALFDAPATAARIGAAGRELVRTQFSWESVNQIFESYCRQAVTIGSKRK